MGTVTERKLEVAVNSLKWFRGRPDTCLTAQAALAEIEAIGKEGEVDAAIDALEQAVTENQHHLIRPYCPDIQLLIAEVRRLREAKDEHRG